MITIGIDPHKDTHTAAAVEDATGQLLGELTVPGTDEGHHQLRSWAHGLADSAGELRFALEDCRHVNGRLERFLLGTGELVLLQRGGACPPRGLRADRGLLRPGSASPPLADGQSQAERGPSSGRPHPGSCPPAGSCLPGEEAGRGQVQQGGISLPKTPLGARRFQGTAGACRAAGFSPLDTGPRSKPKAGGWTSTPARRASKAAALGTWQWVN